MVKTKKSKAKKSTQVVELTPEVKTEPIEVEVKPNVTATELKIISKYYQGDEVLANKKFSSIKKIAKDKGVEYETELKTRFSI